jgi:hypothetical protein
MRNCQFGFRMSTCNCSIEYTTDVVLNFRTPMLDIPNNRAFGKASTDDLPVAGPSYVEEQAGLHCCMIGWTDSTILRAVMRAGKGVGSSTNSL